ncbi:hypothetical protein MMC30_003430 [Trapelia coarctata]|nr:hypothetical protein [Trapelia coarctata]
MPGTLFHPVWVALVTVLVTTFWARRYYRAGKKLPTYLRIRSIPRDCSEPELFSALSALGSSGGPSNVLVQSLHPSPTDQSTQVATVQFLALPPVLASLSEKSCQASISVNLFGKSSFKAVFDGSLMGLTPLSCPAKADVDIIAVPGLGGHAIKSWRRPDREQVWLRDFLAQDVPEARILTYGYDTLVVKSQSKASIADLAKSFLEALKNCRISAEEQRRPIIFLAHSLGGLVVKEALAQASVTGKNEDMESQKIFKSCYGLMFFGVPNKGLNNASLVSMAKGHPNETLIRDLQVDSGHETSSFLRSLHHRFDSAFHFDSRIIAFYENRHTRTLKETPLGSSRFEPLGPWQLIVTQDSATSISRSQKPSDSIAMERDHKDLVKFGDSHEDDYSTVKRNLVEIIRLAPLVVSSRFAEENAHRMLPLNRPSSQNPPGIQNGEEDQFTTVHSTENQGRWSDRKIETAKREALDERHIRVLQTLGNSPVSSIPISIASTGGGQSEIDYPVTTLPTFRNFSFVGRDDVLKDMHNLLLPPNSSPPSGPSCCVLHGLGGQGKSQTALEYAFRYRDAYDATFWLQAETDQELARSYALIAKKLGLSPGGSGNGTAEDGLDPSKGIENARKWLESTTGRKWLLIFDNLEETDDLLTYLPTKPECKGSVIITTQKAHMMSVTDNFRKIPLQPLTSDDGAKLLFKSMDREPLNEQENSYALQISEWVGGLPLAIATIGGYMKLSSSSANRILARLQRSSKVWASSGEGAVSHYKKTLATVFDLALSELKPNTRHLIDIMAFLNPDHIPEEMLVLKQDSPGLQFLNDEDEFLEMTHDLGLRQLVKWSTTSTGAYLSIHRSLQRNVLHSLHGDPDAGKRQRIFEESFSLVRNVVPKPSRRLDSEPDLWPRFSKYVPQVISLRDHSTWPDPPLSLGLHVAKMLSEVGTFLWHTGQFHDCDLALTTAEKIVMAQDIDIQVLPESKDLLSDIYNFTGILCDIVGVSKRADSLRIRLACLDLRKEAYKAIPPSEVTVDDEIRLENAWSDVGCAYMQLGKYDEAGVIFDKMLEYFKRWGSKSKYPFEYAKYYHHCAFVRMAQGKPIEAIEYSKEGVDLQMEHEGEINTMVLINQYDLASLLFNAGEVTKSLELHEEVLEARIRLCGDGSQFTLESYESAATLHYFLGNYSKAEYVSPLTSLPTEPLIRSGRSYLRTCLDWHYRAHWTREGIARAQFRLSLVLEKLGNTQGAKEELKAARAVRDEFLKLYPQYLVPDPADESAVFDQMLPMWVSQFTGKLQKGGRRVVLPL